MWCTWRLPKIKCLKSSRGPSVLHTMLDRVIRISEFSMRRKNPFHRLRNKISCLADKHTGILLLFSSCSSLTCQWEFRICYCMVNKKVVWSIVHLHLWHMYLTALFSRDVSGNVSPSPITLETECTVVTGLTIIPVLSFPIWVGRSVVAHEGSG